MKRQGGVVVRNEHMDASSTPSNGPKSQNQLDVMSSLEIANALEQALDEMTEDSYDTDLIDAYIDALNRKVPLPEIPNEITAYKIFCQNLNELSATNKFDAISRLPQKPTNKRRLLNTLLIASISLIFMLCSIIVVQAAGVDIFGAMARWTEEIFSFGQIRIQDDANRASGIPEKSQIILPPENDYPSLQAALDEYKIEEVVEPKWIPENYIFNKVDVTSYDDLLIFCAEYLCDTGSLNITFMSYIGEPTMQIEKTTAEVEIFDIDGTEFYLLENISSTSVSWVTARFECCITGTIEKQILKKIVSSMFVNQYEGDDHYE